MRNKKVWFLMLVSLVLVAVIASGANKEEVKQATETLPTVEMSTATPVPLVACCLPTAEPDLEDDIQTDPLVTFEEQLKDIILSRDFGMLPRVMPASFGFAFWRSEGYFRARDQAIEELKANYFNNEFDIEFTTPPDLSSELPDGDILKVWDPAANPVRALYTTGWGAEGKDGAFLIIAKPEDLTFHWVGIMFTPGDAGLQ